MVNQQRANNGLAALISDPTLDRAAQAWAEHLAATTSFEHSSSQWRSDMISGAGWVYSGENIAGGQRSASQVMSDWMQSDGHRANILGSSYTGVGVGYAEGGPYGRYWVQIFAQSLPRVTAGNAPTISGTATVGASLSASATGWPGNATLSWRWNTDGVAIPGATGATYVPTVSDLGRKITVTVTGSRSGSYPASKTSAPTSAVVGNTVSNRLAGDDRYATAVAISKAGFDPGVPVVYVASGSNFPDALAAAPAAALLGGPLLLTAPDKLPSVVAAELTRLAPARIVLVGGTSVVATRVLKSLDAIAPTERVAGDTRYETSRDVVRSAFTSANVAYLATGLNFPDALTAGAAAARLDGPVILVDGRSARAEVATITLLRELGVTTVRIAGSFNAVSEGIAESLENEGFTVQRVAGDDRYATAVAVNKQVFDSASTIYLALGTNFPDALAGAALAGAKGAPLFITAGNCIPRAIDLGMTALQPDRVVLLGSTGALTQDVARFQRCA